MGNVGVAIQFAVGLGAGEQTGEAAASPHVLRSGSRFAACLLQDRRPKALRVFVHGSRQYDGP